MQTIESSLFQLSPGNSTSTLFFFFLQETNSAYCTHCAQLHFLLMVPPTYSCIFFGAVTLPPPPSLPLHNGIDTVP